MGLANCVECDSLAAVRRLCDLGPAAVEIVPEARRILDEGAINIKRDGVKLLEEFIAIATE